jgi:hypothetical protein
VLSTIERHNAFAEDPIQHRGGWRVDIDELYAHAGDGAGRRRLSSHTYDDYPVIVLMQLEGLGFCDVGAGAEFVRHHTLTHDGDLPHNTSGGQLSAGQPGAAGGFMGVTELLRQLNGQAGERQVADAAVGLVSGYGIVNYDRCVCSAAVILQRGH